MSSWPNSTAADNGRRPFGRVSLIREGLSSSICRTPARSPSADAMVRSYVAPRETSSRTMSPLTDGRRFAPDGEVDRLQIVRVAGVHVRAAIEQKSHHLATAAEDGTVERRDAAAGSEIHQRGVGVEQGADGVDLSKRRGFVNRMIGGLRRDPSAALSFLFEHLRDLFVAALPRHLDQVAIVQPVPLGIRARIEQQSHGFDVPFAHREMHGRRVPVSRSSETRIALEQPPQCLDVTGGRGDDGVPRVAAVRGIPVRRA